MNKDLLTRRRVLGTAMPALALSAALTTPTRAQSALSEQELRQLGAIDGNLPDLAQLRSMALVNYGHFTTLQAHKQAVRGMGFQIERLQRSTRELFKYELSEAKIREQLRQALGANDSLVLVRANVFPKRLNWMSLGSPSEPGMLITQTPLAAPAFTPQAVRTARYERVQPHIKHVGTFGLFHYRRQAQMNGFDDTLFYDSQQSISEGTTWNIGFHDGRSFVLPTAEALPGGAIHLLRTGMKKLGVPYVERDVKLAELREFQSAFLTNVPLVFQPISRIDDVRYSFSEALRNTLWACYESNPLELI